MKRIFRAGIVLTLVLFAAHELFHFADWLSWGLGYDGLQSVRDALLPFFGAHDLLGYVSHAIVNGGVLLALLWTLLREIRK